MVANDITLEQQISVEVVYAKSNVQRLIRVELPQGSTAQQAIVASGLLNQYPEIDLTINKIGIFANLCNPQQVLKSGDRVEIYRSLLQDPKTARLQRAAK